MSSPGCRRSPFPARSEKGDQCPAAAGQTGLARRRAAVAMIKAERTVPAGNGRVPGRRRHHRRVRQARRGRAAVLRERMAADDFRRHLRSRCRHRAVRVRDLDDGHDRAVADAGSRHRRGRTGAGEAAVLNGGPVRAAAVIIAAVLSLTAAGCGPIPGRAAGPFGERSIAIPGPAAPTVAGRDQPGAWASNPPKPRDRAQICRRSRCRWQRSRLARPAIRRSAGQGVGVVAERQVGLVLLHGVQTRGWRAARTGALRRSAVSEGSGSRSPMSSMSRPSRAIW